MNKNRLVNSGIFIFSFFHYLFFAGLKVFIVMMVAIAAYGQPFPPADPCSSDPTILLNDVYCINTPSFLLEADNHGVEGVGIFYVNNISTNEFNPLALGYGVHEVIYVFDTKTDSADCQKTIRQQVEIIETRSSFACRGVFRLDFSRICSYDVSIADVVFSTLECEDDYQLTIFKNNQPGNNRTLTTEDIGANLRYSVLHLPSSTFCSGRIEITDTISPVIACPPVTTLPYGGNLSTIPIPGVMDFCNSANLHAGGWVYQPRDCGVSPPGIQGTFSRIIIATDPSGNRDTCTQIVQEQQPDFIIPPNLTISCNQPPGVSSLETALGVQEARPFYWLNGEALPIDAAVGYRVTERITNQVRLCGAGRFFFREWTIADLCTGDTLGQYSQLLSQEDNLPPEIVCPTPITIATDAFTCQANFLIPSISVADCSEFLVEVIALGDTYAVNDQIMLPLGKNELEYIVTDVCGNQSRCLLEVMVADQIRPAAICSRGVLLGLNSAGSVELQANQFLDNSSDNCTIDRALIRRTEANSCGSGQSFANSILVCCEDLQTSPIAVQLRVFDAAGNFNDCDFTITVTDNIQPVLHCPPASTIFSDQLDNTLANLNHFGVPLLTNANCGDTLEELSPEISLNDCGTGTILRRWEVTDITGVVQVTCSQTIRVVHRSEGMTVTFPPEDLIFCSTDEIPTDIHFKTDTFADLSYIFEDQVFQNPDFEGRTILRTWRIINECTYNRNLSSDNDDIILQKGSRDSTAIIQDGGDGLIVYTQIYRVIDGDQPILFRPSPDLCLNIGCEKELDLTLEVYDCNPSDQLTVTYQLFIDRNQDGDYMDSNEEIFGTGLNPGAGQLFPIGLHRVFYTVSDQSGNRSQLSYDLEVTDCAPPRMLCPRQPVPVSLTEEALPVSAAWLGLDAMDNCTGNHELLWRFSPEVITCNNLGEPLSIEAAVSDAAGNVTSCVLQVQLQDLDNICGEKATISGKVQSYTGIQLADVGFILNNQDTMSAKSDETGHYQLNELLLHQPYVIRPYKTAHPLDGVTTFDLVLITRHILDLTPFDSPWQMIAADVNRSRTITTFDIVLLRRLILGLSDRLPGGTSWRFVPADVQLEPDSDFVNNFPEEMVIESLDSNYSQDFTAIKVGDVNGSASGNSYTTAAESRSTSNVFLQTPELFFEVGEWVEVPLFLSSEQPIIGFQTSLYVQQKWAEHLTITPVNISEENIHFSKKDGLLRISWHQVQPLNPEIPVLVIKFRALQARSVKEFLQINHTVIPSQAYTVQAEIQKLNVVFVPMFGEPSCYIHAPYPNPFHQQITIQMDASANGKGRFSLYSTTGQRVLEQDFFIKNGQNVFSFDFNQKETEPALYFYKIQTFGGQKTGTLLKIQ